MTAEQIIKLTYHQIRNDDLLLRELGRVYFSIFNEKLVLSCNNCIDDALWRIKHFLKHNKNKKTKIMEEQLFKLKEGLVLYVRTWHKHITNSNLTNQVAIDLLKLNNRNINNFEKYPDNWKELLSDAAVQGRPITFASNIPENKESDVLPQEVQKDDIDRKYTRAQLIQKINEIRPETIDPDTRVRKDELMNLFIEVSKVENLKTTNE